MKKMKKIERPWVHEVLQHNHEHPLGDRANIQFTWKLTDSARSQEIADRLKCIVPEMPGPVRQPGGELSTAEG